MELYLVRHTRVQTVPGTCYGHLDVPLDPSYEADITQTLALLPRDPQIPVFSSPLSRCRTLAERISSSVHLESDLKELNFGRWEGLLWSEIPREELDQWGENFAHEGPPGGEAFSALHARSARILSVMQSTGAPRVICVTHAGVVRSFLCLALGLSPEKCFDFEIDYGSVTVLRWPSTGRCKVLAVNRRS